MKPRSTFSVMTTDGFVLVEDRNQGMSVTNDAENVIEYLASLYDLGKLRVLYRDSSGRWDELAVKDGRFCGFRFVGTMGSWRDAVREASRVAK
jgi:hypothetical protein